MIEVELPDGSVAKFPDGTDSAVIKSALQKRYQPGPALESMPPPPEPKKTDVRGLIRQGLQGITFGTSDEIGAGIAAVPAALSTGRSIPEAYSEIHQRLQDERNQFKQDSPYSALAAEMLGGLVTGGLGAARLAGSKLLSKFGPVAKTAIIGGGEGGAYGALSADRGERAEGAAIGTTAGAVLGPAVKGAGHVLGDLAAPVATRIEGAILGNPERDARRYLASVLSREGIDSIDDLGRGSQNANATLADLSEGARGALEGIVSDVENPAIRKLARTTLESRNAAQQSRLFESLDAKFGIRPDSNVKDAVAAVKSARSATAGPLYDEARSKPVQMTDYMKAVFDPEKGVPEVKSALATAINRTATKRAAGEKVSHIDVIDEMKRVLDDEISALVRQGKNNRVRDLVQVKNKILADVDAQIPAYKAARNAYAGDSALLDAAEHGKRILRDDVDYLDDLVSAMSESEMEMFQLGAKKAIREKLMQAREGTNAVTRIASELNLEKMRLAFPDEASFNQFKDDLRFEAKLFDTSRVLHNSMTALRQAAQKDMAKGGSGEFEQIGSDAAGIVANMVRRLMTRKMSPEAKEELGKLLLTPINDLPPDIAKKLNNSIISKLPEKQRGTYMKLYKEASEAASGAPVAAPAVAIPALQNAE